MYYLFFSNSYLNYWFFNENCLHLVSLLIVNIINRKRFNAFCKVILLDFIVNYETTTVKTYLQISINIIIQVLICWYIFFFIEFIAPVSLNAQNLSILVGRIL